jgi:hypothetical protein
MGNVFGGFLAILYLFWPFLVVALAVGLLLVAPPILAGVLTALTSLVVRIARKPTTTPDGTPNELGASRPDPWARLVALGQPDDAESPNRPSTQP